MTKESQERALHLTRNLKEKARDLVQALDEGNGLRADMLRVEILAGLDALDDELAPNGRHKPCGRPLDEDGECPAWCDQ